MRKLIADSSDEVAFMEFVTIDEAKAQGGVDACGERAKRSGPPTQQLSAYPPVSKKRCKRVL